MASDETFVTYQPRAEEKKPKESGAEGGLETPEEPSFYPPYKWGLGFAARTNYKFFVKDILAFQPMPMFPMAYDFHGHPVYNVEIVGNLFLIDCRRQMDIYGVDDGTGCLKCVVWKRETNLTDPQVIEEIGGRLSKARLGSLVSFTGRVKTYKEKNELTVQGCHVLDSWKELILFRSLTTNSYSTLYFRPCRLPHRVSQALGDYRYEKSSGRKSRRWFEGRVERTVLESLDAEKTGQKFSLDFLEDENIADLLRRGCCGDGGGGDGGGGGGGDEDTIDRQTNADSLNASVGDSTSSHRPANIDSNNARSANNVQKPLFDILTKMESKGSIYFLPFGTHKAHFCVLVDGRCQLTKMTLSKLKHLGGGGGGRGEEGRRREEGFSIGQILSQVKSANEQFCLVQKVAVERCLEILENESEVYGIGKFRYMAV